MKLYIQIENGQTVNHPAFEDNLLQAFGSILANWEPFVRVERPAPNVYEVLDSDEPTYEKIDGIWTDVWALRPMTQEEKSVKQQAAIDAFNAREQAENWAAWTLDEATCTMQPPIPHPKPDQTKLNQRIYTVWCGADNNWKDTPVRPEGEYKFDFFAWEWVPINV
ncbi:MAG: hypothetical protein EBR82_56695 [Caulobacteraceae bacterium]|nr:hypothetical protein [bacterium]NBW17455.1 hypothetical protein [Caulobacteraceae bacterium]NBX97978.1 hypothetical protein [bacterium]